MNDDEKFKALVAARAELNRLHLLIQQEMAVATERGQLMQNDQCADWPAYGHARNALTRLRDEYQT